MKISDDRIAIVEGVLFGNLSEDLLLDGELQEIEKLIYNLVQEKLLTQKIKEGKIVFSGKLKPMMN